MVLIEAEKSEGDLNDEPTSYIPCVKSRRITDFFQPQPVDATRDKHEKSISVRCTRSKASFLPDAQEGVFLKDHQKEETEQPIEQENCLLSAVSRTECTPQTPPTTPHRITLCTESSDLKSGLKVESKSFQKPLTPPKVRRKLNANRLHLAEEPPKTTSNRKVTLNNFLPVRKSVRKTKTTVLEEKQRLLEKILRNNIEEGLNISYFEGKGRGVVAEREFKRGDFVVEYSGDLIEISEAKKREEMYAADQNTGCYMYYFEHNNHKYCIDATPESKRLGRLVNHSRNGNLMTKTVMVDGKPRLVLIAKEDIAVGQEVLYDYGDRSRESLKHHPWLAY